MSIQHCQLVACNEWSVIKTVYAPTWEAMLPSPRDCTNLLFKSPFMLGCSAFLLTLSGKRPPKAKPPTSPLPTGDICFFTPAVGLLLPFLPAAPLPTAACPGLNRNDPLWRRGSGCCCRRCGFFSIEESTFTLAELSLILPAVWTVQGVVLEACLVPLGVATVTVAVLSLSVC